MKIIFLFVVVFIFFGCVDSSKSVPKKHESPKLRYELFVDKKTNLMWQDDISVRRYKKDWFEANGYCENLVLGGYDDWTLPTMHQLISIVDKTKLSPSHL